KDAPKPLPTIARELDVEGIVEGAVVRSGSRVRITAQLIEARSDRHLWAGSYERDLNDVIGLQREVARAIGKAAGGHPVPTRRDLRQSSRIDPAAADALFSGLRVAGAGNFIDAIAYCKKAIAKQPDFAVAYAQMSQYYLQFEFVGGLTPTQYMSEAESAARR